MSHTLNAVDGLMPPMQVVDEQIFTIPEDGHNEVGNRFFKVVGLLQGACWHEVEGGSRVWLAEGDLLVFPHRCRHFYRPPAPGCSHRVHALRLLFDPAHLPPGDGEHRPVEPAPDTADFGTFLRSAFPTFRFFAMGKDAEMAGLMASIRREAEQRRTGFRLRVSALCVEILVRLARQGAVPKMGEVPAVVSRRIHLVEQAREYLVKNLDREITLAKVAWHLRVSEEHLSRVFRQQTGQTVFEFLRNVRLEKAKTYLLGTERSVAEVATLSGFSSPSLFSRTFKEQVGRTPLSYRQERWSAAAENFSLVRQPVPSASVTVSSRAPVTESPKSR